MNGHGTWNHLRTILRHRHIVCRCCFRMGLYRQGLLHDLSKFAPVEFLAGARYYQGDRSPNNREREVTGVSLSWLHHKGRNKHHFEYWVDYRIGDERVIGGTPIPRVYIAEMIADRIGASRVYLNEAYGDAAPFRYYHESLPRLWFVHEEVKEQLFYLLAMLAAEGEDKTLHYIRHTYLAAPEKAWTRPEDFDTIKQKALQEMRQLCEK